MPAPPLVLASARLDLAVMTPAVLRAVIDDDRRSLAAAYDATVPATWMDGHGDVARMWLRRIDEHPDEAGWLARAIVRRDPVRAVVGHCGFHLPPDDAGYVETGYTVEPGHRRLGYAEEAVRCLADAAAAAGAAGLRASVSPTNLPSLSLVAKLGLRKVGSHVDEVDGPEDVFEAPLPLGP